MKVCLVCEGSYPYVTGGVSSWVHMLCSEYKDVDFIIWSIATTKSEMSEYKYELPFNVKKIKTIYIGEKYQERMKKRIFLTEEEKEILMTFVASSIERVDCKKMGGFISKHREKLKDIVLGPDFYNCCLAIYKEKEMSTVFREFLWNLRGMYLPLMDALAGDIPEADIYHAVSTGYAGAIASCASNTLGKPLLLSEHGIYTREREEDIIRSDWVAGPYKDIWIDFFRKLSKLAYHKAEVVTSLFELNKKLQIELGCAEEKIRVIPNGVDYKRFYKEVLTDVPEKETFDIGAVIRIVPIKDVKTMLVSFYQIKKEIGNARLHILGNYDEEPEYYEECLVLKRNLGLDDVTFYGQVNVSEYINKFDVLLLTSISEGQPLAVLEGMAAGKPFVCTNVGDCKGLINGETDEFGSAGYIAPVMNADEIAKAVIALYLNPKERLQMAENGQKRVEKYYQKEFYLKKFRNLYEELGEEFYGGYRI